MSQCLIYLALYKGAATVQAGACGVPEPPTG